MLGKNGKILFLTQKHRNREMIGFTRPIRALCAVLPPAPLSRLAGYALAVKIYCVLQKNVWGKTFARVAASGRQYTSQTTCRWHPIATGVVRHIEVLKTAGASESVSTLSRPEWPQPPDCRKDVRKWMYDFSRMYADVCTNFCWFRGVGSREFFGFCVPRRRD
jgi:hypothetical protein